MRVGICTQKATVLFVMIGLRIVIPYWGTQCVVYGYYTLPTDAHKANGFMSTLKRTMKILLPRENSIRLDSTPVGRKKYGKADFFSFSERVWNDLKKNRTEIFQLMPDCLPAHTVKPIKFARLHIYSLHKRTRNMSPMNLMDWNNIDICFRIRCSDAW